MLGPERSGDQESGTDAREGSTSDLELPGTPIFSAEYDIEAEGFDGYGEHELLYVGRYLASAIEKCLKGATKKEPHYADNYTIKEWWGGHYMIVHPSIYSYYPTPKSYPRFKLPSDAEEDYWKRREGRA